MTCAFSSRSTSVESVVGFQFKEDALDMNFLEPCSSALWCHIIDDGDITTGAGRIIGKVREHCADSYSRAWLVHGDKPVILENCERSLGWEMGFESFMAVRILLDHDGFWLPWRSVHSPCYSLPQWRRKRWYRPVSLHRSAMEKTKEYELIWTVEPGVSELSTVHALRRDWGVELVPNVLGRTNKWVWG
jgi:hypothetical protein